VAVEEVTAISAIEQQADMTEEKKQISANKSFGGRAISTVCLCCWPLY